MAAPSERGPALRPGDLVEGRYRIIKVLGEGGMGTVFLAEHTLIKRRVALKILHAELATDSDVVERFLMEARAAGTLGHPNIVESTDMGITHEAVPYIAFEYLEGALLTDEIYRVGGFPVRRAVVVAMQIANALGAAHNAGIVHRDLKSDNVFLTDKDDVADHVKVLDFGISRFLEVDDEKTRSGMVMGTLEFMAPEQITAPSTVDRRADIYALGVILYEMLTARRPFASDDPQTLVNRIVDEAPAPLARDEVPAALERYLLDTLLAKSPDARPPTMLDVEELLATFVQDAPPRRRSRPIAAASPDGVEPSGPYPRAATQPGRSELPARLPLAPRRPYGLYALAIGGVLVGAVGVGIGALRGRGEPARASVSVELVATVPDARITFRRQVIAAPTRLELTASDIVEMVEVSAPGHKTTRYWLTFDRPTKLVARLAPGEGFVEATAAETQIALGAAPAP